MAGLEELCRTIEGELAQSKEANARLMRACDNLESQLADMTKQRDHYKKACDQYSEDEMLCKLAEVTKQRDALAEALQLCEKHLEKHGYQKSNEESDETGWWLLCDVRNALAATKGGSHE
jgi:predicted nuclease with TOPRIM domain